MLLKSLISRHSTYFKYTSSLPWLLLYLPHVLFSIYTEKLNVYWYHHISVCFYIVHVYYNYHFYLFSQNHLPSISSHIIMHLESSRTPLNAATDSSLVVPWYYVYIFISTIPIWIKIYLCVYLFIISNSFPGSEQFVWHYCTTTAVGFHVPPWTKLYRYPGNIFCT